MRSIFIGKLIVSDATFNIHHLAFAINHVASHRPRIVDRSASRRSARRVSEGDFGIAVSLLPPRVRCCASPKFNPGAETLALNRSGLLKNPISGRFAEDSGEEV
jgi:DNA-binding IclR family transcriptional regulator